MRQTKLALHSATVGDTTYRGWGIAGPMSNIQHNHDNRTIVAGNQFNVSSSGSGNVSVGNVTTNEQAGGKREPIKASCWCKKPDNNEMIFCSFENCPHGWFHFKCIGLTRASANGLPNDWMCHLCNLF